jgi:pilus assembly protein Flp/PilA
MRNLLVRFIRDEEGATAIEYALIASLVSVVMVSVLLTLGPEIKDTFQDVQDALAARNPAAAP